MYTGADDSGAYVYDDTEAMGAEKYLITDTDYPDSTYHWSASESKGAAPEAKLAFFDIGDSETPIIPVMIGDEAKARAFSARLFEEGVFASPIVFPMVPKGTARVRVIVSASFSKDDCDKGLAAFAKVAAELA